tara:strand:- start:20643 stop:20987 length:345 start_codon:yes stop_codon:yes gene_type:complete
MPVETSANRRGDISETEVCLHLLKNNYEVFKNISCVGPADIVVVNNETRDVMFLDVKTPVLYNYSNGKVKVTTNKLSKKQIELGIKIVCIYKNKLYISGKKEKINEVINEKKTI